MSSRKSLVLERNPIGHRANYARTVALILDARCVIGFSPGSLIDAIVARHLVITTFESAPAIYLALLIVRTLTLRRSTVILTRSHVRPTGASVKSVSKRLGHGLLRRLSGVQRLTITPPDEYDGVETATYIEDIEFWDLPATVLENPAPTLLSQAAVRVAGGRPIILVTGTLERSKGLAFLASLLAAHPALRERFAIVCTGLVDPGARGLLAPLAGMADVWEDRYLDDREIYSMYEVATAVWCCYDPSYDVSSGVFGRAVQFSRPTIVRAGSIVARIQDRLSRGLKLDYADVTGSAIRLMDWDPVKGVPASRYRDGAARLRSLIERHAGPAAREKT